MIPPTASTKFNISGMDCADCALTLQKGVSTLPGVVSARVYFSTATLEVQGMIDRSAVTTRVRQLGYNVVEHDRQENGTGTLPRGGIYSLVYYFLHSKPALLAVFATLLLIFSISLKVLGSSGWITAVIPGLHWIVVAIVGIPIARRGIRSLFLARKVTIDLLMSIATLGALCIGETSEAATVIILFSVGEALEGFTSERARHSLRLLLALRPTFATVLRPCIDCSEHLGQQGYSGGECPFCGMHEISLPVEDVRVGDRVLVRPAEHIPVDGQVINGISVVNQAPVTGESMPVPKSTGDAVFAGTVNGEAVLEIKATQVAEDSTISKIIRLVEQAQKQRAPVERFVDRFAAWYTPVVIGVAVLVATIPPLFFGQPLLDTNGTRGWLYRALALLIVACPCALVISTPVTMVSALTGLARRGVLVKGGQFLDALARVKIFAFDKTGTLTRGTPIVRKTWTPACPEGTVRCQACDDMLALAATVERRSSHPLAQAILAEVDARHLNHLYPSADQVVSYSGQGVQGVSNGAVVTIGSHSLFHHRNGDCGELHEYILAAEADGQTVMLVGRDQTELGFIGVSDAPREGAAGALSALKSIDPQMRMVMLTGDNPTVAETIASKLKFVDEIRAGLLPEDKLVAVKDLQSRYGAVAMVGDGVNDAPALAGATVGIAMGGAGTAQAMETADMVLMQDNLSQLPEAVHLSRKTLAIIRQNIAFSLAIKAIFLLLTLPGWATLWMAVFADMGASLIVTANGMRARK